MKKTNVSVIIPTYNRKRLIFETINNILKQSLPAKEIIVVDDNSTDNTVELLNSNYGNEITILKNKGKGPGAARNTGLEKATGEYIKFFDSDDLMSVNTLEEQVKVLKNSNKNYITSPYFYAKKENNKWTLTDNIILNYNNFPQNKPLWHWMIWDLFITIPGMLFKKEFIKKVGPWPTEMITSEDWLYLWKIAKLEPYPAHSNKCAFLYRIHNKQSTGNNFNNLQRDTERYKILKEIYNTELNNNNLNISQKLIFRNKFYQIKRQITDPKLTKLLNNDIKYIDKYIWQFIRIKNKLGRIKTKTDWQPMHSPYICDNIFERYEF